jgi:hypothetical protein
MATPRDPASGETETEDEGVGRLGEGYFILGMAVQVGLVGLVGLALVGVQGLGFLTLGTAVALAGLAIGVLAVGSILTLASLRHTLNVVHDHGNRLDQLAQRVGAFSEELRGGEGGWSPQSEMEVAPPLEPARGSGDPRERRPTPGPGPGPDPLEGGPTYPVGEVPGIGAEAGRQLVEAGIEDTRDLSRADAMYVAGRLDAAPVAVERWQSLARLMALEGVDASTAERLSEAGVTSVAELAHETPERLMRRLGETPEEAGVDPQQAHDWIQAARARFEAGQAEAGGREA